MRDGILGARQRRLAWVGFLLLAAYSPVVAWLRPDDTWLLPITVAGLIGYVLVVDDVLRRRAARKPGPHGVATRGRRWYDDPRSNSDAPVADAGPEMSERTGEVQRPDR